ncbi:hypothetical protein QTQ03_07720 [Micromonospora sp. WMMA1363]|uniref:hypothetical protein n=1 Tax=Micromonospora sp. WMMA1363 TaxID=3053985 RepID=UPI00259D0990|nr:hypothetical protein [Micromonospora sp. WMMA1363]MDM4719490.1 hypothetical protein [Micromonospora sp. WMMA1363]
MTTNASTGVPSSATANTWIRPVEPGSPVCVGRFTETSVLPAGIWYGVVANRNGCAPSRLVPCSRYPALATTMLP